MTRHTGYLILSFRLGYGMNTSLNYIRVLYDDELTAHQWAHSLDEIKYVQKNSRSGNFIHFSWAALCVRVRWANGRTNWTADQYINTIFV